MNEKLKKKLEAKISRVFSKAGLNYSLYSNIVELGHMLDGIPIEDAVWYVNPKSKKEKVIMNPDVVQRLKVAELAILLRREFLNKAMFRNISNFENHYLMNFAVDITSHKLLFLSNPKVSISCFDNLYDDDERLGLKALLIPGLIQNEFESLHSIIKALYEELYTFKTTSGYYDKDNNYIRTKPTQVCSESATKSNPGNTNMPDPLTTYCKLATMLPQEMKDQVEEMYQYLDYENFRDESELNESNSQDQAMAGDLSNIKGSYEDLKAKMLDPDYAPSEQDIKDVEKLTEQIKSVVGDDKKEIGSTGERKLVHGGTDGIRSNLTEAKETEKDNIEQFKSQLCSAGWCSAYNTNDYFSKFLYKDEDSDTKDVAEFVKQFQTKKQIDEICTTIHAELSDSPRIEPYPNYMTRTGFQLVCLGVCGTGLDQIPLYYNKARDAQKKKKMCMYFDTSPSMHGFIPYMINIANFFNNSDELEPAGGDFDGKYVFSSRVQGLTPEEWDEFCDGNVPGGSGTSFEAIIVHSLDEIDTNDVDIIVVFTDGESGVSEESIEKFNQSGKICYPIYFANPSSTWFPYYHSRSGNKEIVPGEQLESQLDELNGTSFTVWVEPDNKYRTNGY